MSEQSMVEPVARAIMPSLAEGCLSDEVARVAIEAMRAPSKEVLKVLEYQLDRQGFDQCLEETWAILIDAALKED